MEPTSRVPSAPPTAPAGDAAPAAQPAPAGLVTPAEPRQRWRLRYRRRPDAPALPQREQIAAWEASLGVSGLPIAGLDLPVPRPRLAFGAPLAVGMAAEAELLDILLTDRRTVAEVRVRLVGSLPAGHELIDVHDVWLGEPALSGRVAAADYRVELADEPSVAESLDRRRLAEACAALLAATTLPRTREKGDRSIDYDLRPLLAAVEVLPAEAGRPIQLRIRTRFDPERGVGRPDEVLAALAAHIGAPLEAASVVRERLVLTGEEDEPD